MAWDELDHRVKGIQAVALFMFSLILFIGLVTICSVKKCDESECVDSP